MKTAGAAPGRPSWHRRARARLGHSLKLRMVLVFVLLSLALALVFVAGAQRAFSVGWREAARPLLADYVDHLVAEITADGPTPSVARAQALVARLPLTVRISGPQVQWASHPGPRGPSWRRDHSPEGEDAEGRGPDTPRMFSRTTADGHRIELGLQSELFERRPRFLGWALGAMILATALAWLYVRRLLRPLDAIGAGARRFGAGEFGQPIPVAHPRRPDELGQLAATINTMGQDIHQMLEAKRTLLLAISHELRSPLTRARLNTELLPETEALRPHREALLRDLQEMAALIHDLLESERLSGSHAALQREPTGLRALADAVLQELGARHPAAAQVRVHADAPMPLVQVDPARVRLLLRNLLDNALRHAAGAATPPELHLTVTPEGEARITVRDHGPGVPPAQIDQLAQAFYRPDSARSRQAGGVGLGLYLCRLVAQAHGGRFEVRPAEPGLRISVSLPGG